MTQPQKQAAIFAGHFFYVCEANEMGARLIASQAARCPRCGVAAQPHREHRCGNRSRADRPVREEIAEAKGPEGNEEWRALGGKVPR